MGEYIRFPKSFDKFIDEHSHGSGLVPVYIVKEGIEHYYEKHAHWNVDEDGTPYCSYCDQWGDSSLNYCGHCGAKMDGDI